MKTLLKYVRKVKELCIMKESFNILTNIIDSVTVEDKSRGTSSVSVTIRDKSRGTSPVSVTIRDKSRGTSPESVTIRDSSRGTSPESPSKIELMCFIYLKQ